MTALRNSDQTVGGWYRTTAGEDDDGDWGDADSGAEYCSLSDEIVTPDSANGFDISSADMVMGGGTCDKGTV